jgi:hypothetical protein
LKGGGVTLKVEEWYHVENHVKIVNGQKTGKIEEKKISKLSIKMNMYG